MELTVNTDGASRGNPGKASYGFIIKSASGTILHEEGGFIGVETNNVAEYTAVLKALLYIKKHFQKRSPPHDVKVITDSQLIASQLSGKFKIKNANLKLLYMEIKKLEEKIGDIRYENVPREKNFIADRLANAALDKLSLD